MTRPTWSDACLIVNVCSSFGVLCCTIGLVASGNWLFALFDVAFAILFGLSFWVIHVDERRANRELSRVLGRLADDIERDLHERPG